jgi:hypothetical protein
MDDSEATSLEQIRVFVDTSGGTVQFAGGLLMEVYALAERTLVRHQYASVNRLERALVRST